MCMYFLAIIMFCSMSIFQFNFLVSCWIPNAQHSAWTVIERMSEWTHFAVKPVLPLALILKNIAFLLFLSPWQVLHFLNFALLESFLVWPVSTGLAFQPWHLGPCFLSSFTHVFSSSEIVSRTFFRIQDFSNLLLPLAGVLRWLSTSVENLWQYIYAISTFIINQSM